jgi:hypothetical protein
MAETAIPRQLPVYGFSTRLCRLLYLHNHGYIQRGAAARAALPGRDARMPTLEVDVRRHRMGADRTVDMSHRLISQERFHDSTSSYRTHFLKQGFYHIARSRATKSTGKYRIGCRSMRARGGATLRTI